MMRRPTIWHLKAALAIAGLSWLVVLAGIRLGDLLIPPGPGLAGELRSRPDLFRFDAAYYHSIATSGYAYNGDPDSSPNIVFAPLYPLLIRAGSRLGFDAVGFGFVINKIFLIAALGVLLSYLETLYSRRRALLLLAAMTTSAGAYSLHAYYSESTLLLLMALILWSDKYHHPWLMAVASGLAGAARLAALPLSLVTAAHLAWRAPRRSTGAVQAAVAVSGAAAFLLFLAVHYGNPFKLLQDIQSTSWGRFHPKVYPLYLLGPNLLQFSWNAIQRGADTFVNIKTINLAWTLMALASVGYSLAKWGGRWPTTFFAGYVSFTYWTGAGSDFLISAHRFYVLLLPVFMMFADFDSRLRRHVSRRAANGVTGLLLAINLCYGLLHAAAFNRGVWFHF